MARIAAGPTSESWTPYITWIYLFLNSREFLIFLIHKSFFVYAALVSGLMVARAGRFRFVSHSSLSRH
jgi:hypothetical protein